MSVKRGSTVGGTIGGRYKWLVPSFIFMRLYCRYCPECKNDSSEVIAAGEKLRYSKKKSNMMSKKGECNRDWGKVSTVANIPLCWLVTLTIVQYM